MFRILIAMIVSAIALTGCSSSGSNSSTADGPSMAGGYTKLYSEQQYAQGVETGFKAGDILVVSLEPGSVAAGATGGSGYDEFRMTVASPVQLDLCMLLDNRSHTLTLHSSSGQQLAATTARSFSQGCSTGQQVTLQSGDYLIRLTHDGQSSVTDTLLIYLEQGVAATAAATKSTTVVTDSQVLKVSSPPVYDPAKAYALFSPVSYQGSLYVNGWDAAAGRCPLQADCSISFEAGLWNRFDPNLTYDFTGFLSQSSIDVTSGGVKVLKLKGTYFEMGWQYGHLLKDDLKKWAQYYNSTWKDANSYLYNVITRNIYEDVTSAFLSPKMKNFLAGVIVRTGMSKGDVYLLNQCLGFDYMLGSNVKEAGGAACTFVGAYGAATQGGATIVGRNLDLQRPLAVRDYNSVITIMQPTTGDNRVATLGFVGLPQGYALLNLDRTVFVEYNTANSADYVELNFTQLIGARDMINTAFEAATDRSNTNAATTAAYLQNAKLLSPTFFGVADRSMVYVVQRPALAQGRISTDSIASGINGVTNVFLDKDIFGTKLSIYNASTAVDAPDKKLDTPARGMVRWENMNTYFKGLSAAVGVETVKTIISRNIADGGVFITGYESRGTSSYCESDATFGSVVIDLNDLSQVWWLRYDYLTQNKTWDSIDLTRYLGP